MVDVQGLADDLAHRLARVQRGEGVLEDDRQLPAHAAQRGARQPEQGLALEDDLALARLDEPQDRAAKGGLAAAGLADQPQRLALPDREVDAVYRPHVAHRALPDAALDGEPGLEPAHLEEGV